MRRLKVGLPVAVWRILGPVINERNGKREFVGVQMIMPGVCNLIMNNFIQRVIDLMTNYYQMADDCPFDDKLLKTIKNSRGVHKYHQYLLAL